MSNLPSMFRNEPFGGQNDPFRALARMQRDMDRIFDRFWSGAGSDRWPELPASAFQSLSRIEDKESHFVLSLDVPGFSKDDIKIEMQGNQLHVFGERKREEKKDKSYASAYGSLEQWFTLPADVKADAIEAKIENGVLQIAVPKSETSQKKSIKIGEGKEGFFSKILPKKDTAA